ncbi:hypothetical protein [uncultured Legionella sp.]|uniref:hypothetical protein n=1 Tax=uncultured Legionella sp. TaxID=210934 RepID=UPI002609C689|nr:hypothetical protein [uncultured Legionella sp.]
MRCIKKYSRVLYSTVFLLFFLGPIDLFSCPCFNMGFLHSEFLDNQNTQCYIYKEGNIIYKIDIFDEKNGASSTHTSCSLETDHHDVYRQFSLFHLDDHYDCIREILDACNRLHLRTQKRDY